MREEEILGQAEHSYPLGFDLYYGLFQHILSEIWTSGVDLRQSAAHAAKIS